MPKRVLSGLARVAYATRVRFLGVWVGDTLLVLVASKALNIMFRLGFRV